MACKGGCMICQRWITTVVISFVLVLTSSCASNYMVKAKVWDLDQVTNDNGENWYPELHGDEEVRIPRIANNMDESFGVAFSGGGTRAASAALGQLRALHELDWITEAEYFSMISGGAWAVIPYLYFDEDEVGSEFSEEKFLGPYRYPREITDENFACEKNNTSGECHPARFSRAIDNSTAWDRMWLAWQKGKADESFAFLLEDIFLKSYNLHTKAFFTWSEDTRARIDGDNRGLEEKHPDVKAETIAVVRDSSTGPYPIVGTVLMANKSGNYFDHYAIEITPNYVGIRNEDRYELAVEDTDEKETVAAAEGNNCAPVHVGGGYVEPIGYDSLYPNNEIKATVERQELVLKNRRNAFRLADVMATTGAAPQATLHRTGKKFLTNLGLPEFNYWHVDYGFPYGNCAQHLHEAKAIEHSHGDGGHLDNLGLMPLLARKVKNILVLINTQTAFEYDHITNDYKIYDNVTSFFDLPNKFDTYRGVYERYPHNVVFEREDFVDLIQNFGQMKIQQAEDVASPLVYCRSYTIRKNPRWDVNESYKPNICWVYLDRSEFWIEELAAKKAKQDIKAFKDPFKRFPHYWTFIENARFGQGGILGKGAALDRIIEYSEPQINALSSLTAWTLMYRCSMIGNFLGLDLGNCDSRQAVH